MGQNHDLLLNVFNFILSFLQVDDLDRYHAVGCLVDTLEHLAERSLPDRIESREAILRVDLALGAKQIQK